MQLAPLRLGELHAVSVWAVSQAALRPAAPVPHAQPHGPERVFRRRAWDEDRRGGGGVQPESSCDP